MASFLAKQRGRHISSNLIRARLPSPAGSAQHRASASGSLTVRADASTCVACPQNAYCFFGECFCKPGFHGADCTDAVANPWVTGCPNLIKPARPYSEWSNELLGCKSEWKIDCHIQCYWAFASGIAKIPNQLWAAAQHNELTNWQGSSDKQDRDVEHRSAFYDFAALKTHSFGDMIEIGSGPFTQTRNVLGGRRDVASVKSITLVEPNANAYMTTVKHCAYKDGSLLGYKTHILSAPGEGSTKGKKFDTAIMLNVVEHAFDAFDLLWTLWDSLKVGGVLIFHERWVDSIYQMPREHALGFFRTELFYARSHPLRITQRVIHRFMDQFDPLFVNVAPTKEQLQRAHGKVENLETGVYFIGRKLFASSRSTCCAGANTFVM